MLIKNVANIGVLRWITGLLALSSIVIIACGGAAAPETVAQPAPTQQVAQPTALAIPATTSAVATAD